MPGFILLTQHIARWLIHKGKQTHNVKKINILRITNLLTMMLVAELSVNEVALVNRCKIDVQLVARNLGLRFGMSLCISDYNRRNLVSRLSG